MYGVHPLMVILLGTIVVVAMVFQARMWSRWEKTAWTVYLPSAFGLISFLGSVTLAFFLLFAPPRGVDFDTLSFFALIGRGLLFYLLITVKAYFGPMFSGVCICWIAFNAIQNGSFEALPVLSWILSILFDGLPSWVSAVYTTVMFLWTFGTTGFDSVTE